MTSQQLLRAVLTFAGIILAMVLVGWVLWRLVAPQLRRITDRSNQEIISVHDFFILDPETPTVVLEGERLPIRDNIPPPQVVNGDVFLPVAFVRAYIDPFMFWDNRAQTLFVTTRTDMLTFPRAELRVGGGEAFVPAALFMRLYPFSVQYHPEYNTVVITDDRLPRVTTAVSRAAPVRYRPEIAAPMTTRLEAGAVVTILAPEAEWTWVRTETGLLGYIYNEDMGNPRESARVVYGNRTPLLMTFIDNTQPRTPNWPAGQKINLVWENPYSPAANAISMETPLPEGLTVISPTWFRFNAETMALDSVVSYEYVLWAREQGVQVWPNVSDTSAFQAGIEAILSSAQARHHIIEQLVYYVDSLGLDGLSINIEHLFDWRYGPYFIQFIRELNVALGNRVILLAAMKVCPFINAHYRHDLVALTIDFVALMTYDEHAGHSPEPGPVSSLPWVTHHLETMLTRVPANQLIMGLAYFNRVWRVPVVGGPRRSSLNWGMERARNASEEFGVEWEWDDVVGAYYGEWAAVVEGETLRHQLWLVCERSLAGKMQLFNRYNLAGVAGWSREFTNQNAWDFLARYFIQ